MTSQKEIGHYCEHCHNWIGKYTINLPLNAQESKILLGLLAEETYRIATQPQDIFTDMRRNLCMIMADIIMKEWDKKQK